MKYEISVYEADPGNSCRFTLGTSGNNPLFVIGLNPSTADDKTPDRTITKVMGFTARHNCDSFIMLNIYPKRTKDPYDLPTTVDDFIHTENIEHILSILSQFNDISILAAWSERIQIRPFLKQCLSDIFKKTQHRKINWLHIGMTQSGHPRHPSRAAYNELTEFNIEKYLEG